MPALQFCIPFHFTVAQSDGPSMHSHISWEIQSEIEFGSQKPHNNTLSGRRTFLVFVYVFCFCFCDLSENFHEKHRSVAFKIQQHNNLNQTSRHMENNPLGNRRPTRVAITREWRLQGGEGFFQATKILRRRCQPPPTPESDQEEG